MITVVSTAFGLLTHIFRNEARRKIRKLILIVTATVTVILTAKATLTATAAVTAETLMIPMRIQTVIIPTLVLLNASGSRR